MSLVRGMRGKLWSNCGWTSRKITREKGLCMYKMPMGCWPLPGTFINHPYSYDVLCQIEDTKVSFTFLRYPVNRWENLGSNLDLPSKLCPYEESSTDWCRKEKNKLRKHLFQDKWQQGCGGGGRGLLETKYDEGVRSTVILSQTSLILQEGLSLGVQRKGQEK